MCILDILAVVPFYVELIMIVTGNNNDSDARSVELQLHKRLHSNDFMPSLKVSMNFNI